MSAVSKLPRLSAAKGLRVFDDGRALMAAAGESSTIYAVGPDGSNGALVPITFDGDSLSFVHPGTAPASYPTTATAIAISNKGDVLAIANEEKEVVLYSLPDMSFLCNITRFTLAPRAIAFNADDTLIACGGDDQIVRVVGRADPTQQIYELPVGRAIKVVSVDPIGRYITVASQDGSVSIFDIQSLDKPLVKRLEGCKLADSNDPRYSNAEYPLLWHPSGAVFAVASDQGVHIYSRDGFKQVYNMRSPSAPTRVDDVWNGTCALAWSPNGRYLLAVDGRRLATVWDMTSPATDPISKSAIRKNATGDSEPAVAMHGYLSMVVPEGDADDLSMGTAPDDLPMVEARSSTARITSCLWAADGDCVVFADTIGHMGHARIAPLLHKNGGSVVEAVAEGLDWPLNVGPAPAAASTENVDNADNVDFDGLFDDVALESKAEESKAKGANEAEFDFSVSNLKRAHGFEDVDDDGEDGLGGMKRLDDSNVGDQSVNVDELIHSGRLVTIDHLERHVITTGKYIKEVYGLVPPQQPFQPTSTRFSRTRVRRYLVWNNVGTITCRRDAAGNFLAVDFHDIAKHRSINFTDLQGLTMATMNEAGAFFASPYLPSSTSAGGSEASEDGLASHIRFKSFGGFGTAALDWSLNLPVYKPRKPASAFRFRVAGIVDRSKKGHSENSKEMEDFIEDDSAKEGDREELYDTSDAAESATAIAMGEGWCAVATDRHFLRFFRSGGIQDMVFSVPGSVVTMAARGAFCAVAYHRSLPTGFCQHISVDLYLFRCSVEGSALPRKLTTLDLPMRPYALLQWLGFAPNGMLLMHDTLGTLFGASAALDWAWTPVCDTKLAAITGGDASGGTERMKKARHDSRDSYWPVDIIMAPPAASSAPEMDSPVPLSAPGGVVPTVVVVLCKGGNSEPTVSKPLPLTNFLSLRVPVVDTSGASENIMLDELYLRHEYLRLHRTWMNRVGLSNVNAVSLPMQAAMSSASANARGVPMDAAIALQTELAEQRDASRHYSTALDKAVIASIKLACESDYELKAVQLATRLHGDRSFVVAQKVAGATQASNAAERFSQMLAARQAVEGADLGLQIENVTDFETYAAAPASRHYLDATQEKDVVHDDAETAPQARYGLAAIPGLSKKQPTKPAGHAAQSRNSAIAATSSSSMGAGTLAGLADDGADLHSPVVPVEKSPAVGTNPFVKRSPASPPKRSRPTLDNLATSSPAREGPKLNRQASFAADAREAKRARLLES